MMRIIAVELILAVLLMSLCAASAAQEQTTHNEKETCVRKDAPRVIDGLYEFQYDSFVRATSDPDRFVFDRCVLNHKPHLKMLVDWKGAGVVGHTNTEGIIRNAIESDSKEYKIVDAELWYGLQPRKTNATYREVKEKKASKTQTAGGTLRSRVQIGLPPKRVTSQDEEKNIRILDVNVEMESSAIYLDNHRVLYTYSWRDRSAADRKERFVIRLPQDIQGRVHAQSPVFKLEPFTQGVYFEDDAPPVTATIEVQFLPVELGEFVGSSRMSVFRPRRLP